MLPGFTWLSYIMAFTFGAAVGSFLGVIIDRSNGEVCETSPRRSRCDNCKRQLKWWENIPIVSFISLKGKCRTCRSPIPYWLPLIELAGGIAGVWLAGWAGQTIIVINFINVIKIIAAIAIAAALIWVFFSDLVYGVIPDLAIAAGVAGAITMSLMSRISLMGLMEQIGIAAAAAGFFLFLVLITCGRGMGTGDVTLAAFLGLWLGWPKIVLAVWLAFIFGAVAGLILIGLKLKRFGQTIPFGPFLIAAAIIAAMVNDNWRILIGL